MKIAVLMATFNGHEWLELQLDSVLNQVNVDIQLFVSDDLSEDATFTYLKSRAAKDERITVLPQSKKFGSAGKNFYRLIQDTDLSDCDYIAFSDQDDIWQHDKCIRHVELIRKHQTEAVSSNVTAFWSNGKKKRLINHSHNVN